MHITRQSYSISLDPDVSNQNYHSGLLVHMEVDFFIVQDYQSGVGSGWLIDDVLGK